MFPCALELAGASVQPLDVYVQASHAEPPHFGAELLYLPTPSQHDTAELLPTKIVITYIHIKINANMHSSKNYYNIFIIPQNLLVAFSSLL